MSETQKKRIFAKLAEAVVAGDSEMAQKGANEALAEGIHPYDAGMVLDKLGIAVRTGTHCNQPVMDHFKITGTLRASLAFYNTTREIDRLYDGLHRVLKMFG